MEFYGPVNEVLQRYIEGYYFISPDKNPERLHYWTFNDISYSEDQYIINGRYFNGCFSPVEGEEREE